MPKSYFELSLSYKYNGRKILSFVVYLLQISKNLAKCKTFKSLHELLVFLPSKPFLKKSSNLIRCLKGTIFKSDKLVN